MAELESLLEQAITEVKTSLMNRFKHISPERGEKRARENISFALENAKETTKLGLEVERRTEGGEPFSSERITFYFETMEVSKKMSAQIAAEIEKELRG